MIQQLIPKQSVEIVGGRVLIVGVGYVGQELAYAIDQRFKTSIVACDINERNLSILDSNTKGRVVCELIDCSNHADMKHLIEMYNPTHIVNTAAFKHVRLGSTAISRKSMLRNNVSIIRNIVSCVGMDPNVRITHISTDKSVYPTTYMGWTKLISDCEALCANNSNIVRFGNVYGSSGSIVDLIKTGTDITIHNADVVRYFIDLNDAIEVILTAMCSSSGFTYMPMNMTAATIGQVCSYLNVPIQQNTTPLWRGEKMIETLSWQDECWEPVGEFIKRAKPSSLALEYIKEFNVDE